MGGRAALLFAILTAARSGEVRGATWAEIDLDKRLWTVPAARMKAGRAHRVPLSDDALALLRVQRGDETPAPDALVFPALRGGELSDMALTSLLRKAQAESDVPGRIATAHGFRSSFRNWAADHGVGTELAERALAHTIGNKVQAAYERSDRLDARVKLMQSWADHVMGRAADARVVSIRGVA
jgi:integrase